ncbi:MAG: UDP-N-acetylglucosamine 1-carboxyvinyltransferase [Kiritimatiellae bacterium]|nr:UDP-N-acetylglucosamine 1-carboxyvinyltransferase [Kiritimatiellia bacterium]
MARFIIRGQKRLSGRYRPAGNKNAALPMLAACVLTDEPVVLQNVPVIEDVEVMLQILEQLGVAVARKGHTVNLCAAGIRRSRLKPELCAMARSSILFAGPLAARHGRAVLMPPGGDVIGRRRLDTHFYGLQALGIDVAGGRQYSFRRRKLRGAEILLDEASVTATENILMAATLSPGETVIFNAACEPHVQDLCALLAAMGARIDGVGTNRLRVQGVARLHGARHRVQPDHIEIGSFAAAALVTGGELRIEDVPAAHIAVITRAFRKLGAHLAPEGRKLRLAPRRKMRVVNDFGEAVPKIEDGPWPGFPSDLMSVAIVLATQARGTMLFFEKMFESRLYFVDRLIHMGARIVQCDPHRVLVVGPARLHGTHLASPDIRAGMAMLVAALAAGGESVIDNAQSIDRGYERIEHRLRALGADITREE